MNLPLFCKASWQSSNLVVISRDAVKSVDYKTALSFCSAEPLKKTPREQWVSFLASATRQYGAVEKYTIMSDSCAYSIEADGQAGKGNYHDVFVQSQRGGEKVMEKIVFFQKKYNETVRLAGHYFL